MIHSHFQTTILAAIALFTMSTATQGSQDADVPAAQSPASSTATMFMEYLDIARNEAVKRNVPVVVCPSNDEKTCLSHTDWSKGWIVFSDANRNRRLDADDAVLAKHEPISNVNIFSTSGRKSISYAPTGNAPTSNVTYTFCDAVAETPPHALIVSRTGGARLSDVNAKKQPLTCPSPGANS